MGGNWPDKRGGIARGAGGGVLQRQIDQGRGGDMRAPQLHASNMDSNICAGDIPVKRTTIEGSV